MTEKRMLIVDTSIATKIDENRGDMNRSEFLKFLIDNQLEDKADNHDHHSHQDYLERKEFYQFARGMRELLRNFLEFFLSYGLELGKQPQDNKIFEELSQKLRALGKAGNKNTEQNIE